MGNTEPGEQALLIRKQPWPREKGANKPASAGEIDLSNDQNMDQKRPPGGSHTER
jgi:hypothetical protein